MFETAEVEIPCLKPHFFTRIGRGCMSGFTGLVLTKGRPKIYGFIKIRIRVDRALPLLSSLV